uniref:Uncharacterized protein n=1 Tax=Romanomermis culicivorax TaxID=13658 RepID=A0A915IBZ0_ROMCU
MAVDMKNFQFAVPMPANSTASSYPPYVQLAFPNGTMFVFETFAATPEDWTMLFSLIDGEHTIVVSFDGADDWVGIYALLGTQFRTDPQKKNKDPVVKAIHFNVYCVIQNIDISPPLYELASQIGFFPEKRTLKATVPATRALDVSKLTLKFPPALCFFNNPGTSFLQWDVLEYAALDTYYLLLLFLAFRRYSFVPEVYNAPALFPPDSLDATEINHLAETIIAAFHNVAFSDVLPTNSTNRVYPTISQIALPAIMRDEVFSANKFFMFDCTSSDHGRSFCLGTVPNSFRENKVLTPRTHPKLLTALKVPKKKKKKQKDKWNKSPDVPDNEDPALQPQSLFDDRTGLQAAITSAMKGRLPDRLIELLNFPVLPTYKLAISDPLIYETDPALSLIPHEVDDMWIECITANQPLPNRTYQVIDVEPADKELLDTLIFDLNKVKLLPSTDVSALPLPAATADLTLTVTQITDFLKLTLDEISTFAQVLMDESTPIQPTAMDAEINTTTDQMLTDIPEESTLDQSTSIDVMPAEPTTGMPPTAPTMDPPVYLATPATLPSPPIIATVAPARPAAPVPQVAQPAPVIAQAAIQLPTALPPLPVQKQQPPGTLLRLTAPMDVQTPQAPSTSAPALDHHSQFIQKPGHYKHSMKCKQHHQEEAHYRKSHKMRMIRNPAPSACRHPVLRVLSAAKRPGNEQPVATNKAISKKLVKRPINLVRRLLPGRSQKSSLQKQQRRLPATQKVTIHAMSGTLVTTTTEKKPNNPTLQAVAVVNMNATMIHHCTTLRVSKHAKCTPQASMKMHTNMVSGDHHRR